MGEHVANHQLTVKQMRRFHVGRPVADERRLRGALLSEEPEIEVARPMPGVLRTLCNVTILGCGIALNLPSMALGSQATWEIIQKVAPIL